MLEHAGFEGDFTPPGCETLDRRFRYRPYAIISLPVAQKYTLTPDFHDESCQAAKTPLRASEERAYELLDSSPRVLAGQPYFLSS